MLDQAQEKVKQGIEEMNASDVTEETIDNVLKNVKGLHSLIGDMHRSIMSGLLIT
jgi:hypothetical protein